MLERHADRLLPVIATVLFVGAALLPTAPAPAPAAETAARAEAAVSPEPPRSAPPSEVRVPILTYHQVRPIPPGVSEANRQYEVPPEAFERQIAWLKENGYESVSFDDLHDALTDGAPLPEKSVIITFDDGRDSPYVHAYPILRAYGFTATFFPFSNAIGRPGYLTWEQLKEMRAAGMETGSHTRYHAYLTRLADDEELDAELVASKRALEEGLGEPVTALAYPFGLRDARVIGRARDAGYETARSITQGATHTAATLLDLGSFMPTEDFARFVRLMAE